MLDSVIAFFSNNPVLLLVACYFLWQMFQRSQPFPESGGLVTAVKDEADWDSTLKSGGQYVLADFYATWCPPCRTAAPVYGRMSLEFSTVRFVKVDVDQCRAVSSKEGIQAMPTFKLYKDGKSCDSVQGFSESGIRASKFARRAQAPVLATYCCSGQPPVPKVCN